MAADQLFAVSCLGGDWESCGAEIVISLMIFLVEGGGEVWRGG
jgi:hypothetical protein